MRLGERHRANSRLVLSSRARLLRERWRPSRHSPSRRRRSRHRARHLVPRPRAVRRGAPRCPKRLSGGVRAAARVEAASTCRRCHPRGPSCRWDTTRNASTSSSRARRQPATRHELRQDMPARTNNCEGGVTVPSARTIPLVRAGRARLARAAPPPRLPLCGPSDIEGDCAVSVTYGWDAAAFAKKGYMVHGWGARARLQMAARSARCDMLP